MNRILTLGILLFMAIGINAQSNERLLTEEQVFSSGKEYAKYAVQNKNYTWWGDELVELNRQYCSIIDKKTAAVRSLFTKDELNEWMNPDSTFKQNSLRNISFPYANKSIVMLRNGNGLALFDFKAKQMVWKTTYHGAVAEQFAKESCNHAIVRDGNVWVYAADGKGNQSIWRQITQDGDNDRIVYGQAVHRNEWGIEGGLFWSKDGRKLAFYRMDQSMVQNYPLPSYLKSERVAHDMTRYPMAGDVSHKVTIGVYDTETGKTIYLNAGDPTDRFFTNISWSPDSKTIYLFEVNRLQNHTQLDAYDAVSGELQKTLYTEDGSKYVEPLTPIEFLPWDNSQFVLQTRKDGWNHLYIINVEGQLQKQLTCGEFEVLSVLGFCPEKKGIIIKSNESGHLNKSLYFVDLKTGTRTLLDNGNGVHGEGYGQILSPSGKWLYDNWSSPETPRKIDLISTISIKPKESIKSKESTKSIKSKNAINLLSADDLWAQNNKCLPIFESGSIKAADGETDLYYRMVKPWNFDPQKKYPAVVYVYGGPHARNVLNSWHYASRPWETIMSQEGYIVFILDNRGSAERGLAFEQATWHQLGKVEMEDQMEGVKFLKSQPYVDGDRLGVHGWSFGGFMTCSLMTTYPNVFKVGVAGGPVIDWKWYEIMYGERYMGTPQNNPEGYKNSSLLNKAGKLQGRLLVITGMSDPTVVPQNCLNFVEAAENHGKLVDFYAYPDEGHNMRGHKQVTLHHRITRYFKDFLK